MAQRAGGSIAAVGSVTNVIGLQWSAPEGASHKLTSGRSVAPATTSAGSELSRFTFPYPIKKPDNETVGGENNASANARR